MADGYIVYQGDAKGSVEYFKKIDRPMPQFANPADFFMKILAIKYPKKKDDEEKIEYLNRYYHALIEKSVKAENRMIRLEAPKVTGADVIDYKATTKVQLEQLMNRSWILVKREPAFTFAKIMQTVIIGFLMIGAFWKLNDYSTATSVKDMAGAIYYMCITQMTFNFQPTVIVF